MSGHRYTNTIPASTTVYSGLQIQTTSACLPVPICWGQSMFGPTVFWYENFQKHPQGAKGGKTGGKGSSSGKSQQTYTYTAAVMMALCEGPIAGLGMILNGSPPGFALSNINSTLVYGNTPQSVWSYLTSAYPGQALAYNGVAYICSEQFDLGGGATIGSYTFEVYGVLHGSGFNGVDADPALVIQDFLTNPHYGVGLPSSAIDAGALLGGSGTSSYQAWCWANGLAISPVLNNREQASSILSRWLQITHATAVWTSGVLKIIPFGDGNVSGNGWTWVADTAPLYDLTDEDFIYSSGEDPIQVTRADPYSIPNWQSIEIQSRADYYNSGPIIAQDQSFIDRYGLRIGSNVTAHEICVDSIAQTAIQLILQRGLYVRNTFKFKLSWEFCLLDPMDLVTLTDPYIGLAKTAVRIVDIEEDDAGLLTVTAEEFPTGVATSAVYATAARSNGYPDPTVAAPAVNPPVIFEPPPALTGNTAQIWAGVSGVDSSTIWGGCLVWASLDGVTYAQIASLTGSSAMGVTTSALTAYTGVNPDMASTLGVDLSESLGALSSTTPANAAAGATCAYVGGEYIAFTTATLTGSNIFNLTGLYRGMYGIASKAIPIGSPFVLLSGSLIEYAPPPGDIGDLLYLKFQSVNIFGAGIEDLSTCAVYSHTVAGTSVTGPVTSLLLLGLAMDFGLAGQAVTEADDWGDATSAVTSVIDLGSVAP